MIWNFGYQVVCSEDNGNVPDTLGDHVKVGSRSQWSQARGEICWVEPKSILPPVPRAQSLPSWGNFAKILYILRNIRVRIMSNDCNNCERERWGDDFSYLVCSLPTTAYTIFHYNQCSAMWEHWFWVYDRPPDQHWAKQTCQYCWMNTFRIRTWQIWECIWNWDSPGAVLTGGHHKSAATSPARPRTLESLP